MTTDEAIEMFCAWVVENGNDEQATTAMDGDADLSSMDDLEFLITEFGDDCGWDAAYLVGMAIDS